MKNEYKQAAIDMIKIPPSNKIIKMALKMIKLKKDDVILGIIALLLGAYISWKTSFSFETVVVTNSIISEFLNVQLALFGIIFTIYSIILAFFNDNMLKILSRIKMDNGEKSKLKEYLSYYEKVLFLYFVNIAITFIIKIFISVINNEFIIINKTFSDILAFVILFIYYSLSFRVFLEIKSTIYNTISLFRINISYKFIDFLSEDNDE